MIDWGMVGRGALWIAGLALALASFSYIDWWRYQRKWRLRFALSTPRFQAPFSAAMVLFCVGLALSSRRWWEIGAWGVLAASFAWQTWFYGRSGFRHGWDTPPPSDREPE